MEDTNPAAQVAKEARIAQAMEAAASAAAAQPVVQGLGTPPAPAPVQQPSTFSMPQLIIIGLLAMLLMRGLPTPAPGPAPTPGPTPVDPLPGPGPTPPKPTATKLPKGSWLVVVESTEDRHKFPHLASLQKDTKFWSNLHQRGYKYTWLDSEEEEAKAYAKEWDKVGLPALLGVVPDPSGSGSTVPLAIPCPPTTELMEQYLEQ